MIGDYITSCAIMVESGICKNRSYHNQETNFGLCHDFDIRHRPGFSDNGKELPNVALFR
jgi:hypothetical protein